MKPTFLVPSNGDRRIGVKIGRSLIDRSPDRVKLPFQVFLKQTYVRAVNEQVGTHFQESRLLLNLSPEVYTRANAGSAGFAEDGLASLEKVGVIIVLWNAEAAGQVVRANQHGIQPGHSKDGVEGFDGGDALDVDDEQAVFRASEKVGSEFTARIFAIKQVLEAAAFDRAQLDRTAQGLHLLRAFHVGSDHPRRTAVERHGGGIRVGRGNAHQRRQAQRSVSLAHPAKLGAVERYVLGVDEDEVQPAISHHLWPARRG
jgi:hypothetical protein